MSNFRLTLSTPKSLAMVVLVDGKRIKGKKKRGSTIYKCKSDKNMIDVNIFNIVELDSKIWWLWSIFYFVIGIFGIFDGGFGRVTDRIQCAFRVSMADVVNMSVELENQDDTTCLVQCDTMYKQVQNSVWQDNALDKKIKQNNWLRVGLWVISLIIIASITMGVVL